MQQPTISIITVVYNASLTLEATIKSVLNQDNSLFEYWIIDGGSTDGSIDIIRKYEAQLAGWVSERDEGIFDAMNKGIEKANGDWFFFLGGDDMLVDGILAKVFPYLKKNLAVVYGDVLYDNGGVMHSRIGIQSLMTNTLHHQSAFYHKSLFDNFRYNQKFNVAADYELSLRIYLHKQPSLYVPYIISIFATGGYSSLGGITDVNIIRGLYLKNRFLNGMFSVILKLQFSFVLLVRKLIGKQLKQKYKKKLPLMLKNLNMNE